jgi:anion-transporting  ArsA/GET3 family ATPase
MVTLLERKLIVVTGKGGTGKTTMACAFGLLGAQRGLRTIVVELGDQHRLPALFGHAEAPESGVEVKLEPHLWSTSIDPDKALLEWLRTLAGRFSARMLAASSTFHYFAAAAPGAKELVSMVAVRRLGEQPRSRSSSEARPYDLVVLDAPATGHALAMLRSPQTFASIVRVGPLADQAQGVRALLEDPRRSAYIAVAQGTEMAVTETLELEEGLRRHLDRDLDAILINGTLPRRFTREELGRIAQLDDTATSTGADDTRVVRAAALTAHSVYEQARLQQSQIARLRRQRLAQGMPPDVIRIPFAFTSELDLTAIREIAGRLDKSL